MFPDELVVGDVRVQGPHQVSRGVLPSLGHLRVALAPVRVRVAHQIHPVASPALSEAVRVQHAANEPHVRVR